MKYLIRTFLALFLVAGSVLPANAAMLSTTPYMDASSVKRLVLDRSCTAYANVIFRFRSNRTYTVNDGKVIHGPLPYTLSAKGKIQGAAASYQFKLFEDRVYMFHSSTRGPLRFRCHSR